MGVGQIPDVVFEQDHHRQTRGLLALVDHFKNAGVRSGEANHRTDRLARLIGGGNPEGNLVAGNIVGSVSNDLYRELVFRLAEQQALRHRSLAVVVNRGHDHAIEGPRKGECDIVGLVSLERDAFEGELFAVLSKGHTISAVRSSGDSQHHVLLPGRDIGGRGKDDAGSLDGRERKHCLDPSRLSDAERIRFAFSGDE